MNKPASLREAVQKAAPALENDPGKLLVFVDKGQVVSHGPGSLSFEYRYTLNLVMTDMSGTADPIIAAVLGWAQVNQPELLAVGEKRNVIQFEVDHLNHNTYDLSIELPLTEGVRVTKDAGGALAFQHVAEQAPDWMR
jgi:hypothetical protein